MQNVTIDLSLDIVRETLIALRDRQFEVGKSLSSSDEVVREIARRQLGRIEGAIGGIEDALEAATGIRA